LRFSSFLLRFLRNVRTKIQSRIRNHSRIRRRWPDRWHICRWIEALYRLGKDVSCRVAQGIGAEVTVKVLFLDVAVFVVDFHMHLPFCDNHAGRPFLSADLWQDTTFVKEYIVLLIRIRHARAVPRFGFRWLF